VPEWVPFAGLTAVVLLLLLALARASQGVVRDDQPRSPVDRDSTRRAEHPSDADADAVTTERHAAAEGVSPQPGSAAVGPVRGHEPGAAGRSKPTGTPELTTRALLANVALTQGLFGGIVLAGVFFYDIPPDALGVTGSCWNSGVGAVALGVVFGVALWVANKASAAVADAVGAAYDEQMRELLAPGSRRGWVVLLAGVLPVIAVVEEVIFRAAIIGVPAAGFGVSPWVLAVLSSAAFAVGHGAQGRVGVAVTGGLGFVLAAGYVVSGSLLVVVVATTS
jgi:membrane protease YdiL (CAAX protease family)